MASITCSAPARKVSKPRSSRPRPARSASLHSTGGQRILALTVGADTTFYRVEPLAADFGAGYRLHKADRGYGPGEVYDVLLDGARTSCECKGHLRWGHCKHVEALAELQRRRLLPAAERPARQPAVEARGVEAPALPPQAVCTLCRSCPVDAEGGYDTCDECLARQ